MSLTVTGVAALQRRLHAMDKVSGRPLLGKIQIDARANAKRVVHRKTSNLGRSIVPGELTDTYTIVKATANYAAYVELGTRPHDIPKNGQPGPKTLRFANTRGGAATTLGGRVTRGSARSMGKGAFVFRKVVHHPGTKPYPFLVPGAQKAVKDNLGVDIFVRAWNNAA